MGRRLIVEADGGARGNPGPAGFGAVVRDAGTREVLREVAGGIGHASNNVAEYRGLIAGLTAAADLDPEAIEVRMDSKLVVEQMSNRWKIKHPDMQVLAEEARRVVGSLGVPVRFTHIARELNGAADRLANEAMDAQARGEQWAPSDAVEPPEADTLPRLHGWMPPTSRPLTTLLLRHGQTPLSVEKRFSGIGDPALTETGLRQAAAAAKRLEGLRGKVSAVVSSPLARARTTAELAAEALGLGVSVDEDLRETDFGVWEGLTFSEVAAQWPADLQEWRASDAFAPPHGESFRATARRVAAALGRLQAAYDGKTVVVVSHVTPIKTLTRMALEAPPSALYRLHLDLCSLTTIDWYADGPAVLRGMNDTSHLDGRLDSG